MRLPCAVCNHVQLLRHCNRCFGLRQYSWPVRRYFIKLSLFLSLSLSMNMDLSSVLKQAVHLCLQYCRQTVTKGFAEINIWLVLTQGHYCVSIHLSYKYYNYSLQAVGRNNSYVAVLLYREFFWRDWRIPTCALSQHKEQHANGPGLQELVSEMV